MFNFVKKIFRYCKRTVPFTDGAVIIPRKHHSISRGNISRSALKVLYRLHKHGYQAYLVGGGIRDLLLEREPKDFDVVTNALPEQVKSIFSNCRLIGRRFRLAHVVFGYEVIEVATFRGGAQQHVTHAGMIVKDNTYGTLEEDVWRRDFTVNALYYNIADFSLVDYTGGLEDLKNRELRLIGDPQLRYQEDPVRMLRAIRFAAKLKFHIHQATAEPIARYKDLLVQVPPARLFEEYIKLFLHGAAKPSYDLLKQYHLFQILFPQVLSAIQSRSLDYFERLIDVALVNSDARVASGKSLSPAFLLSIFLWGSLWKQMQTDQEKYTTEFANLLGSCELIFQDQKNMIAIPKRFTQMIRDIWSLQLRLKIRSKRQVHQIFAHPKFRAGYDFLLLRAQAGDVEAKPLAEWWTQYIGLDDEGRWEMTKKLSNKRKRRRKPKLPKGEIGGIQEETISDD